MNDGGREHRPMNTLRCTRVRTNVQVYDVGSSFILQTPARLPMSFPLRRRSSWSSLHPLAGTFDSEEEVSVRRNVKEINSVPFIYLFTSFFF